MTRGTDEVFAEIRNFVNGLTLTVGMITFSSVLVRSSVHPCWFV